MNTEKMTVHRALAELKVLDSRIQKKISSSVFCTTNRHREAKVNGEPIETFKAKMLDDYKSIMSLINRREAIKKAVTLSNAKTVVEIAGKKYTVAEAIEMRNSGITNHQFLANIMRQQYAKAKTTIETENGDKLSKKADDYVTGLYGSKDGTKSEKVTEARKDYIEANSYDMVDPIGVSTVIESIDSFVDKFIAEVDSSLSVSNAITEIEFSYEVM